MPKRRRLKRKIARQPKPKATGGRLTSPNNLLSMGDVLSSIIGMKAMNVVVVLLATIGYYYIDEVSKSQEQLPPIPKLTFNILTYLLPIIGIAQVFIFWRFFILSKKGPYFKSSDAEYLIKLTRWQVAISIIALAVVAIPLLYISGFTEKTAVLIGSRFPNLGPRVSAAASYIITIVVSGVIGNFAYDVLRRLIARLFGRHTGKI